MLHSKSEPDIAQRLIVGPVLIVTGVAIYFGLLLLIQLPGKDLFAVIGLVIAAEAYGTIAGLFVLLGLQYVLGPRNWIEERITKSLSCLLITSSVMTAIIIAIILVIVFI